MAHFWRTGIVPGPVMETYATASMADGAYTTIVSVTGSGYFLETIGAYDNSADSTTSDRRGSVNVRTTIDSGVSSVMTPTGGSESANDSTVYGYDVDTTICLMCRRTPPAGMVRFQSSLKVELSQGSGNARVVYGIARYTLE